MNKKITIITLIASLIFISLFPATGFAENQTKLDGIQEERRELQQNLSEQEQQLNELVNEMQQLEQEVEALNEQMAAKQTEVDNVNTQIEETIEEIEDLQAEIETLEESIEHRFDLLKTRASSYQQNGGVINYIEVLFGSQSFGDFISRLTAVTQIVDSDVQLMEQIDADIQLVEAHQLTTAEKLDALNEMHAEIETQLTAIEEEKEKQQVLIKDLNNKQQEVVAYVSELESEDMNLQAMENEVKAEIAAAIQREKEAEEERKREAARVAAEEKERKAEQDRQAEREKAKQAPPMEEEKNKQQPDRSEPVKDEEDTSKKEPEDKKSFMATSTAYTANCDGCSGKTATGIDLIKNPDVKVIAVDPSVISLGSVVHVEGYGYALAADTGGAIKGNKIDVYVKTKKEALNWGVRTVKVTVQ